MLIQDIERLLQKNRKMKTLQFSMNVPELEIHYTYSNTVPNQRFHSASVGKLITATLIFIGIEQGKITLNTPIKSILESSMLNHLFVFKGVDFQEEVTIKHLLGHTSGINDYFEGKTLDGSSFINEIISKADTFWTPLELVDFTRKRQQAIAAPGQKFFYSDTGYILLGLVIEKIFRLPFHQALHEYIFKPSGMEDTCLCFYSESFEQTALAPLYINRTDIHLFKSLSCDFSGGGLCTTANDLLKFINHLQNHSLISKQSLEMMSRFEHRYRQGLYYGNGMMQVRFEEFFLLLKNLPQLQGHIGVTGVHAWYDPTTKASFVLNVGNTKDMVKSFKLLIVILQLVQREYKKLRKLEL